MANSEREKQGTATATGFPEHGPIENGKEVLLSIKNIDITFGKGGEAVKAVKNASFDIYKGETFSLVGESGSGKTTIGRAVIRVNPLSAGEILYKGVRISGKIPHKLDRKVIRNIQMVFQDPAASLNERATVDYIISEGLYNFHLYKNEADRVQKVENMIREVGLLPEHLTRYPHEFSGGQRQRIGIARAMVMEPELVVADEPISALDVSIRAQVLNLLKRFQAEKGITYLFIAHDLSVVRFISDRIGVIYKGNIVEVAEAEELFNFPLHPYTHSLISAIPIPDPRLEKNKVLYTYDPSMHDYSVDEPEFVCIGHDHWVWGNKKEIEQYRKIRERGVPLKSIEIQTPDERLEAVLSSVRTQGNGSLQGEVRDQEVLQTRGEARDQEVLQTRGEARDQEVPQTRGEARDQEAVQMRREAQNQDAVQPPREEDALKEAQAQREARAKRDREVQLSKAEEEFLKTPLHDTGNIWYGVISFFLPVIGIILAMVFRKNNYMRNYKIWKKGAIIGFIVIAVLVVIFLLGIVLAVI